MDSKSLLQPVLKGRRFEGGAIPLELLRDLSVLQEMLIELAKLEYFEANQNRHRVPRYFLQGIEMHITSIDKGSAVPNISLASYDGLFFDPQHLSYFEKAVDKLVHILDSAARDEVLSHLPKNVLHYFKKLGKSLQEGEVIEFSSSQAMKASLNKKIRRRLVTASGEREYDEDVVIRAMVFGLDKKSKKMDIDLSEGRILRDIQIPEQHYEVSKQAHDGYQNDSGPCVLIQGTGVFDSKSNALQRIEAIEHISLLDPLDAVARLDEFKRLKDGWLEGYGQPPDHEGLDKLGRMFESYYYPTNLQFPYLYPTEDGNVRAEWSFAPYEISLEIQLSSLQAEWHELNLDTDQDASEAYNLSEEKDWPRIIQKLTDLGGNLSE